MEEDGCDFSEQEIKVRLDLDAIARQNVYGRNYNSRNSSSLDMLAFNVVNLAQVGISRQALVKFYYDKVRHYRSMVKVYEKKESAGRERAV